MALSLVDFLDFLMVSMASDLKTLIKAADIMRES
jgi:hypothetical protein